MGCGCPERADKGLDFADRHGIPLPGPVRRHFEKVAGRKDEGSRELDVSDKEPNRRRTVVRGRRPDTAEES